MVDDIRVNSLSRFRSRLSKAGKSPITGIVSALDAIVDGMIGCGTAFRLCFGQCVAYSGQFLKKNPGYLQSSHASSLSM